jgi:hypothetical protein
MQSEYYTAKQKKMQVQGCSPTGTIDYMKMVMGNLQINCLQLSHHLS